MMLSLSICLALQQDFLYRASVSSVSISNLDTTEVNLLERILTRRGYDCLTICGTSYVLGSSAPQAVLDSILNEMPAKYGVRYFKKEGRLRSIAPKYSIDISAGTTLKQFSRSLSSDSHLYKVVAKTMKNEAWTRDSHLLGVTYAIWPWIDDRGKNTEQVVADLTFFVREQETKTLTVFSSD